MYTTPSHADTVIIGGGFYGCCLARYFRAHGRSVILLEKEQKLLTRASYRNQARVHNGYHYPRSMVTALRSRVNYPRFMQEFRSAVEDVGDHVYAIARVGSKVDARQFVRFCQQIGAAVREAPERVRHHFSDQRVEAVFVVREAVFNVAALRDIVSQQCNATGVDVRLGTAVRSVAPYGDDLVSVTLDDGSVLVANEAFNCTYAQINAILDRSGFPQIPMKHELTELALIAVPDPLAGMSITVMDGPFFSLLPFPDRHLHTLSHVRYTPHAWWHDRLDVSHRDMSMVMQEHAGTSNFPYMVRDAQRYVPLLAQAQHLDSLFEVKTVLLEHEMDDGRPILFRRDCGMKHFHSIMGGKIDNIYDILHLLDGEECAVKTPSAAEQVHA